jgi:signal transduction histidine kinase
MSAVDSRESREHKVNGNALFQGGVGGNGSGAIRFRDLFDIEEIQKIQDRFAAAIGVASIITDPSGHPITKPSNFSRLCQEIIRETPLGCANCRKSDSVLGQPYPDGPRIQKCLSGGLWDGGTSICAGEHHVANWLIGQVRDDSIADEKLMAYCREIGANEVDFARELQNVVRMSRERFQEVGEFLFVVANQLSMRALQNLEQKQTIEALKVAEETARVAREQIEIEGKKRTMFLATMAHEVRTPLNAILGFCEILTETKLEGEQVECVKSIVNGSEMLRAAINDFLDFSRVDSGKFQLEYGLVDVREVIESCLDMQAPSARGKGIAFGFSMEPGCPATVSGDLARLRQILTNLISNAIKFTASGEIHLTARGSGKMLEIEVRDTGVGLAPSEQEHIFDPFTQASASTARQFGGTGLGLAICKKLVDLMGGTIRVASEKGRGSSFVVVLPV